MRIIPKMQYLKWQNFKIYLTKVKVRRNIQKSAPYGQKIAHFHPLPFVWERNKINTI